MRRERRKKREKSAEMEALREQADLKGGLEVIELLGAPCSVAHLLAQRIPVHRIRVVGELLRS